MSKLCVSIYFILEDFRERNLRAEKELEKKSREITELSKLLENKTKHNALLEKSLKQLQDNFEESTRTKDKQIAMLTSELDAKAGNIAYLTKQLHDSKVAYSELNLRLLNMSPNMMDRKTLSPAPPGERAPIHNRRRYIRKVVASNGSMGIEGGLNPKTQKMLLNVKATKSTENLPSHSARTKTPTPKGSRSLGESPSHQSRKIANDYTEFLKTGSKPEPKLVYRPVPNPLPPIVNGIEDNGTQVPYKVHRSRGQDAGIVDEIIVSPLNSPDKSWRQGSNQYDPVS